MTSSAKRHVSYPLIQKTKLLPHPTEIVLCHWRAERACTGVLNVFQPRDHLLTTSNTACGLPRCFLRKCRNRLIQSFPIVSVEIFMDNLSVDIRRDLAGRSFLVLCHGLFDSSN